MTGPRKARSGASVPRPASRPVPRPAPRPAQESRHLWHPDILEIFQGAADQGAAVTLTSRMRLAAHGGDAVNVVMTGRIAAVEGQVVRFVVTGHGRDTARHAPVDPACDYAFTLELLTARERMRVSYEGRGAILGRTLGEDTLPRELEIRIGLPSRVRRLRRHGRVACGPERIARPAFLLLESTPRRRPELRRLLRAASEAADTSVPVQVLNLSLGGVCLLAGEAVRQKLMAAQERYLVSFHTLTPDESRLPLVFLGRKVGVFPRPGSAAALRIRFLSELDWDAPGDEVCWLDIERSGSRALRRVFRQWEQSPLAQNPTAPALPGGKDAAALAAAAKAAEDGTRLAALAGSRENVEAAAQSAASPEASDTNRGEATATRDLPVSFFDE